MLKKITYISLLIIIFYFIYTIFFKKIENPVNLIEKEMISKNVVYRLKDEAIIYADKQIGANEDKIIKFDKVTIDFLKKGLLIKGNQSEVNTETLSIILNGEVEGRTKDKKWILNTDKIVYEKDGEKIKTDSKTKIVNEEDKLELVANKIQTTVKFQEISGMGNVNFKKDNRELVSDKLIYEDNKKIVDAIGNVKYKDNKSKINANRGIYYLEKKQLDVNGNVEYTNLDLYIKANHIFYDELKEIANSKGNGKFYYKASNSSGTFQRADYDLKNEILNSQDYYTMNYDDYKLEGSNLMYILKTGEVKLRGKFNILKQNFKVEGTEGEINTSEKNILANKMVMTSIQGDRIVADIGNGSFEKREFKFEGNVQGKIRGNIKNFFDSTLKLKEEDAIKFRGNSSKIYFLLHKNNEMSISRSEIKGKVLMNYKNLTLNSEYNEIDASKNLILAREKVIVDLKNEIQMTSNFLYYNLNTEEGTAQNNVKIISISPKVSKLNMSSEKAIVNMKKRKVFLSQNVTTYQGKNKIVSDSATYDIDKKTLENNKNIKMQYEVQNNLINPKKSEPKNVDAIDEILKKELISQREINNNKKIFLPRKIKASNGVVVDLKWRSSNNSYFDIAGNINKNYYGGRDKNVILTLVATAGIDTKTNEYKLIIPAENKEELLIRASQTLDLDNKMSSVKVNISNGIVEIPIIWDKNIAILKFQGEEYRKKY